jgi:hypothetical protein
MEIKKYTKKIYEFKEEEISAIVSDLNLLWKSKEISQDSKDLIKMYESDE